MAWENWESPYMEKRQTSDCYSEKVASEIAMPSCC